MRILFISVHALLSPRQAGFHFLARTAAQLGYEVKFVTVALSPISIVMRDIRFKMSHQASCINRWASVTMDAGARPIDTYAAFTPFHPVILKSAFLRRMAAPLLSLYGPLLARHLTEATARADMVIVESCIGLLALNVMSKALERSMCRVVYRVSDDLVFHGWPASVVAEEERFLRSRVPCLVSCPVDSIARRLSPLHPNVAVHRHGVDVSEFERAQRSPYPEKSVNAVYVGISHFDAKAFATIARAFADVHFHVFGLASSVSLRNVTYYGERPFAETIPYVKFADIGLNTRSTGDDRSLRHSLKIMQYTYCQLPIVGPAALDNGWGNYFGYAPDSEASMTSALAQALAAGKCTGAEANIRTWEDVLRDLISNGET